MYTIIYKQFIVFCLLHSGLDEGVLYQVLGFLEQQLDKTQGRAALHDFFTHKAGKIIVWLD